MNVDILCTEGSPMGVTMKSLYGTDGRMGVGGSEQYLMTLCSAWHNMGHRVRLYNNPKEANASDFIQLQTKNFNPEDERDVLIVFRSPNNIVDHSNGKKIFLSCDQRTSGNYREFAKHVSEIVTISPFHSQYFLDVYGIQKTTVIDIPVRMEDYKTPVTKIPKSCMFNSVPDRGVDILAKVWPRIMEQVPDATLRITSGWTLWDGLSDNSRLLPYRRMFLGMPNVEYLGAVTRSKLVEIQLETEMFLNTNRYQEMFCIAGAEAQVAGAIPVTSTIGALDSTMMFGKIYGNPDTKEWQDKFVQDAVDILKLSAVDRTDISNAVRSQAISRFSPERILEQWNSVLS
jgi:glycosyltransferase involved in cell wall biosynthesis